MVTISKQNMAARNAHKNASASRRLYVLLSLALFGLVFGIIRALFYIENKEMRVQLRYDGKTYVAKVKVGNMSQAYHELYDALPDQHVIYESLFGRSSPSSSSSSSLNDQYVDENENQLIPRDSPDRDPANARDRYYESLQHVVPNGMANYEVLQQFAPKCTEAQLSKMAKALPEEPCISTEPWEMQCAFTKATTCNRPTWFQEFHKSITMNDKPFRALFVGCDKGKEAVNALRMGSRNERYSIQAWFEQLDPQHAPQLLKAKNCFGQVEGIANVPDREASVVCLEPSLTEQLTHSAQELGWNIALTFVQPSSTVSLDEFVPTVPQKFPASEPIHFLYISSFGYAFNILKAARETLARVQYVEFEYTWKGAWAEQHLADAVAMLQKKGFVCYWPGEDRLWRLSGCWQEYYSTHSWSRVACVNTAMPETKPLVDLMEQRFAETLSSI